MPGRRRRDEDHPEAAQSRKRVEDAPPGVQGRGDDPDRPAAVEDREAEQNAWFDERHGDTSAERIAVDGASRKSVREIVEDVRQRLGRRR